MCENLSPLDMCVCVEGEEEGSILQRCLVYITKPPSLISRSLMVMTSHYEINRLVEAISAFSSVGNSNFNVLSSFCKLKNSPKTRLRSSTNKT